MDVVGVVCEYYDFCVCGCGGVDVVYDLVDVVVFVVVCVGFDDEDVFFIGCLDVV